MNYSYERLKGRVKKIIENEYSAMEQEFEVYEKEELSLIAKYILDDNSNIIESVFYKPDGSSRHRNVYKYNDKGNRIEKIFYETPGNHPSFSEIYKYDEGGKRIECIRQWYSSSNNLPGITIYKYDEIDNEIAQLYYKDELVRAYKTFKYDMNGNIVEERFYQLPYNPDLHNNPIIYGSGALSSESIYVYEYDKTDNWIKKISITGSPQYDNNFHRMGDDIITITEREIEYD